MKPATLPIAFMKWLCVALLTACGPSDADRAFVDSIRAAAEAPRWVVELDTSAVDGRRTFSAAVEGRATPDTPVRLTVSCDGVAIDAILARVGFAGAEPVPVVLRTSGDTARSFVWRTTARGLGVSPAPRDIAETVQALMRADTVLVRVGEAFEASFETRGLSPIYSAQCPTPAPR